MNKLLPSISSFLLAVFCGISLPVDGYAQRLTVPETGLLRPASGGLQADFLVCVRIPGAGMADCMFVRYWVTADLVRFKIMWGEPRFTTTAFPAHRGTLSGYSDGNTSTVFTRYDGLATVGPESQHQVRKGQFHFGRLRYDWRDMRFTPLEFVRRTPSHLGELIVQDSCWNYPKADIGSNYRLTVRESIAREESYRSPHSSSDRQTIYGYNADLQLRKMTATLPEKVYWLDADTGIDINVNTQFRQAQVKQEVPLVQRKHVSVPVVPVRYHADGRKARVDYATRQLAGQQVSVPERITVVRNTTDDRVKHLRLAECLDVQRITTEEAMAVMTEESVQDYESDFYRHLLALAQASNDGYRSPKSERSLKDFVAAYSGSDPAQPLWQKLAVQNRITNAMIYRGNVYEAVEHADRYLDLLLNSPAMPFLPECCVSMLKRAEWSGTQNVYDALLERSVRFCEKMPWKERLISTLSARNFAYVPFALLRFAGVDAAGNFPEPAGLTAEDQLLQSYLVASLTSALRLQQSENADKSFAKKDTSLSRENLNETKLRQLAETAHRRSAIAFAQLPESQQARWILDLKKIEAWSSSK